MKILDTWPSRPTKQSKLETARPFMDGQIYQFTIEDCEALFGIPIVSNFDHNTDAENDQRTKYLRGQALNGLYEQLSSACRRIHGPYQARRLMVDSTVIFQWVGLQSCRLKGCDAMAVEGCKGYCDVHFEKKRSEGNVT